MNKVHKKPLYDRILAAYHRSCEGSRDPPPSSPPRPCPT
jgi:hypothetical protein